MNADITAAQAHYVLSRMISDKLVSKSDVARYLGSMQGEIKELEQRLAELRTMHGGGGATAPRSAKASAAAPAPKARKKVKLTPQQRASRQLQGVYMSLIRQFPATKRAPFKKLGKEKGRQAAVEAMKSALNKSAKK
jgi:hypothetical protein